MVNIAIIDCEPDRRDAMVKAFDGFRVTEYWTNCTKPIELSEIVLFHYRDQNFIHSGELCKNAELVVYYGGNGEPDPDWNKRRKKEHDQRIWRAVKEDGTNALTPEEGHQLLIFAESLVNGIQTDLPSFLCEPPDFSTLIALSILCQGYIAACDPKNFHIRKRMELFAEQATPKDQFGRAGWWLNILCEDAKTNSPEEVAATIAALKLCVGQEWGGNMTPDPKPVYELLGSIKYDSTPTEIAVKDALENIRQFLNQQQT